MFVEREPTEEEYRQSYPTHASIRRREETRTHTFKRGKPVVKTYRVLELWFGDQALTFEGTWPEWVMDMMERRIRDVLGDRLEP